jgi:hypothetical protein
MRRRKFGGEFPEGVIPGPRMTPACAEAVNPAVESESFGRRYRSSMRNCAASRVLETIDSELRLVAALRRAARDRGGPLPSIDLAEALLDERRELTELGNRFARVRV